MKQTVQLVVMSQMDNASNVILNVPLASIKQINACNVHMVGGKMDGNVLKMNQFYSISH